MRRRISILALVVAIFAGQPRARAYGEVIDKIAAVVDGRIITLSDVRKEHQIQAAIGDPVETDEALLQSLIDRALLEEEMEQFPVLDVSDDEIEERMRMVSDMHGVAAAEIRNAILRKIQRRKYLDLRYRQFIVISNVDIENEYQDDFVPAAMKKGIEVPDLNQVIDDIREILFENKVARELETSLEDLRARSNVEVFQ